MAAKDDLKTALVIISFLISFAITRDANISLTIAVICAIFALFLAIEHDNQGGKKDLKYRPCALKRA